MCRAVIQQRAALVETFDVGIMQQADIAADDQIRTADIEVVAAAALHVFHLESGLALPEIQPEAARLQPRQQVGIDLFHLGGGELVRPAQHGEGEGRREQVTVVQRRPLVIQRIDLLRLRQADDVARVALDHGHVGTAGLQVLGDVMGTVAGADDQRPLALPVLAIRIVAGVHDRALKHVQSGQVGDDGNGADTGGEDDMTRTHHAFRSVPALKIQGPGTGRDIMVAADKRGVGPAIEFHRLDIELEPVRQHVLRDIDRPGRWKRHVGQMVDVDFVVQGQGVVTAAPVVADALVLLDQQGIDAQGVQPRRNGQSGLSGPDHDNGRFPVRIGAGAVPVVLPVGAAEFPGKRVAPRPCGTEPLGMVLQPVQGGHQGPGAQFAGTVRVRYQPDHTLSLTCGGAEIEENLQRFPTGAFHLAGRCPVLRKTEA